MWGPWPSTVLTETVQKVLEDSSGVCQGTGDKVALAVAVACVAEVESRQQLCKGRSPMGPSGRFRLRSSLPLCHLQILGTMQTIPVLGRADDLGLRDGHVSLAGGESTLHQFGAVTSSFPLVLWLGSVNCLKGLPVFKSSLAPIQCEQASPVRGAEKGRAPETKGAASIEARAGQAWAARPLGDEQVAQSLRPRWTFRRLGR